MTALSKRFFSDSTRAALRPRRARPSLLIALASVTVFLGASLEKRYVYTPEMRFSMLGKSGASSQASFSSPSTPGPALARRASLAPHRPGRSPGRCCRIWAQAPCAVHVFDRKDLCARRGLLHARPGGASAIVALAALNHRSFLEPAHTRLASFSHRATLSETRHCARESM